ncbi:MAG: hypothetical protein HKL82_07630 [Acidimicrobiaceae bacterium]|nr:hypothetical protein [Acidimicrobiaceae bacterium]
MLLILVVLIVAFILGVSGFSPHLVLILAGVAVALTLFRIMSKGKRRWLRL